MALPCSVATSLGHSSPVNNMGARRQGQESALWKCFKVFRTLVVTVKTCVLRVTTKRKKVINFFEEKVHP